MKKILFSILAVAAVSVSCTKFAEDPQIDFKDAVSPAVTAKTVADDAIEVTVTAQDGTSWFSYIVAEGEAATVNASTLLQGGLASAAVTYGKDNAPAAEVIDFEKKTTVSLAIDGLKSNTAYTVYAVASNDQGVVSEVAVATTVTTDETAPDILRYASQEQEDGSFLFQIVFDDPVKLSGKGSVTAHYYGACGGADSKGNLVEQKSVEIPAGNLYASSDYLIVEIPAAEYIPGAIVALTYTQGIVVNGLGAECAAFDDAAVTEELESEGIVGQYDNVPFQLSINKDGDKVDDGKADGDDEENEPVIFTDWTKLVMLSYSQGKYPLSGEFGEDASVKITVVDGKGRTVSYEGQQFGVVDEKTVSLALDEDPGYGVSISYTIAEGSLLDIYGNGNAEFTVQDGYFCSYGYTIDDILGTYTLTGKSPFVGMEDETVNYTLEIKASDDAEFGNVMITDVCGIAGNLYCEADFDAGTLLIYETDIFSGNSASGYCTYFGGVGDKSCTFGPGKISVPGVFSIAVVSGAQIIGFATGSDGKNIGVYNGVATRQ